MQRSHVLSSTLTIAISAALCSCMGGTHVDRAPSPATILATPAARVNAPDAYFALEYQRIDAHRAHFGFAGADDGHRPPRLVGLALSGGGIRSNAFQLGVLAGLHAEPYGSHNLLDRIDYTSSASGGSWAAGAVWAWPDDMQGLFACLDSAAEEGKQQAIANNPACADATRLLRVHQDIEILSQPHSRRKEAWRKAIEEAHLPRGCDIAFDQPLPQACAGNLVGKPYPIFNSTHSALSEGPGADGFPFQTTPDGAGTVVDKGSRQPGGDGRYTGFFIDFHQPDTHWIWRDWFRARLPGGSKGLDEGTNLSLTMAHSSGLIKGPAIPALALSYYMALDERAIERSDHMRAKYKLTDGGKSENTGIASLVERGTDIIVASYMGKENDTPFGDLDIARQQSRQLFGCELANIDESASHPRMQAGTYACPGAPDPANKTLLHIHPWASNIGDFIAHLASEGQAGKPGMIDVARYLEQEATQIHDPSGRFPQTRTLQADYDERLIRAYYLLGRFSARRDVAPYLRSHIADGGAP